jgi:hypothetical protein
VRSGGVGLNQLLAIRVQRWIFVRVLKYGGQTNCSHEGITKLNLAPQQTHRAGGVCAIVWVSQIGPRLALRMIDKIRCENHTCGSTAICDAAEDGIPSVVDALDLVIGQTAVSVAVALIPLVFVSFA